MVQTRAQAGQQRTTPPLLGLPLEVRLQIFEALLGGHTIHVGYPDGTGRATQSDTKQFRRGQQVVASLCQSERSSHVRRNASREESTDVHEMQANYFPMAHRRCIRERQPPYGDDELNLLLINRQTYAEASRLPFERNTFTFHNPRTLVRFTRCCEAYQRKALRSIEVLEVHSLRLWANARLSRPFINRLTSLRSLDISIDLVSEDLWSSAPKRLTTGEVRKQIFSCLRSPRHITTCKVTVRIVDCVRREVYLSLSQLGIVVRKPTGAELDRWEREIEAAILS
ncbi:hypothetical protein BAUCODRAFT_38307 [Baudoinia panamericana UAMH 10762]|uniref:DUF7730 domain-containing protein n=1 Tax=Baudoinia panamericana (strain UAMH 10762) TaxID=717646 RepID=M2N0W4_BAUPA|nr:uncharacterized protein BAUCODRAFT_38307 [Baudoinia panamericana UAMH 10762]EMC92275.1 hypothetical protein BAUCODRAFT_38307 [Baudoinia panamericana UAMH 10762]